MTSEPVRHYQHSWREEQGQAYMARIAYEHGSDQPVGNPSETPNQGHVLPDVSVAGELVLLDGGSPKAQG